MEASLLLTLLRLQKMPAQPTEHQLVGLRIKSAREQRGFTLEWVARQLHICPSSLSRLENGIIRLDVVTARRLASVYRMTLQDLFG